VVKRLLDALFTAVILLLAVPTTLILISWNALPGDNLYPLKSSLENSVLLLFSGTPLVPKVSIKFTDRKLTDATSLLNQKGSTIGYDLLVAGAAQTQSYIAEKSDVQSAAQFSQNIDGYKQQIEKKKTEVNNQIKSGSGNQVSTPVPSVNPSSNPSPVFTPVPTPQVFVPTPTEQAVSVSLPQSSVSQTTGETIVVNVPETVVIKREDPQLVLQKLNDTETQLTRIQNEVNQESSNYSNGRNNNDNNNQGFGGRGNNHNGNNH